MLVESIDGRAIAPRYQVPVRVDGDLDRRMPSSPIAEPACPAVREQQLFQSPGIEETDCGSESSHRRHIIGLHSALEAEYFTCPRSVR